MSSRNAQLSATVISTALELGITDFIICAGARNAPLIANLSTRRKISLWNHFDERAAAFFALGIAKASGNAVAIVTTSGTAAAELLPAVIEAWYSGIPLVLITADRPSIYRGSGAPQAIDQVGLFYGYVGQFLDLEYRESYYEEICWDRQSPLHLNICLDEPQVDTPQTAEPLNIAIHSKSWATPVELMPVFEKPAVIIGELNKHDRTPVIEFLRQTGIPFWAEAISGLREHPELKHLRLDSDKDLLNLSPNEIIRIGGIPSLRFWRDLESTDTVRVINFTNTGFSGLGRIQDVITLPLNKLENYAGNSPQQNVDRPPTNECSIETKLEDHPESEPAIVRELSKIIPSTAAVFLGNSMPIREWNLAAELDHAHPHCYASRGANGIDGQISTCLGISHGHDEIWGIFGDLTSLYDMNALWMLNQLQGKTIRIVVLNNKGGRIFSRLPAMTALDKETVALTENHHQIEFNALADLWNVDYARWDQGPETWKTPTAKHSLIEIQIDQEKSEAFWGK